MKWPVSLPRDSIDAFAYYGSWPHWPVPEADEAALLARMDRLGIRSAVVLSLAGAFSDPDVGNQELAGLVRRHPGRFAGMAAYDPRQPTPPRDAMQRARDAGLTGLALYPNQHDYTLGDEPLVNEALSLAAEWHWPVVIPIRLVMSWWLPETPVKTIIELARQHSQVPIMVAGVSYGELYKLLESMGELTNIYLEISATQSLDALKEMVRRAGPQRILFGTGQPIQMPECNLIKLATAQLDEQAKEAILRGNAARLFGLS